MRHCVSPECCGWPACKCTEDLNAPRAAEAGEPQNEILRRIGDRGLALAQKGIGKEHLDLWQHLLDEVQRLSSRPAIIEECARVCEGYYEEPDEAWRERGVAEELASAIRALV